MGTKQIGGTGTANIPAEATAAGTEGSHENTAIIEWMCTTG